MTTDDFAMMQPSEAWLEAVGLPACDYPVPITAFKEAAAAGGQIDVAYLLLWLQQYSACATDWETCEPAMRALIGNLAPHDDRLEVSVRGDRWALTSGAVDLATEIVTVQRGTRLVAAISPSLNGSLRAACYRPLDAKAIQYLLGLALVPAADGTVCMRENNFEYAKDCAAGTGRYYAFERGESHLSYWEHGLGLTQSHERIDDWYSQRSLPPFQPAMLAVQLGVYFELTDDDETT